MQHNLDGVAGSVGLMPLTPIIADRISKNCARPVERGSGDGSSDIGVSLESMLGVLIPIKMLEMICLLHSPAWLHTRNGTCRHYRQ